MSPEVLSDLEKDIVTIAKLNKIDFDICTMGDLWGLLTVVSRNRAFDDEHPYFKSGVWQRVLPFDGRDFCWYYKDGLNDEHVRTALNKIKQNNIK